MQSDRIRSNAPKIGHRLRRQDPRQLVTEERMSVAPPEGAKGAVLGARSRLAVRSWPVWGNPRRLVWLVVSVIALDAIAIGIGIWATTPHARQFLLFALLVACSLTTVELTRRAGENAGMTKDVCGVWELPIAILLPPVYALIGPIPRIVLTQIRTRHMPVYKRAFTAAVIGLSFGGASLAFHVANQEVIRHIPGTGARTAAWILAVAACGALQWAINNWLIFAALKTEDPTVTVRTHVLPSESLHNDAIELCVAVLVTLAIASTPVAIAFALPFVTLLQRSHRHAQLVNDSRLDSKTKLLNAGTWEREAGAEVARANRTRTPLAVALIDVDNFKVINDTHGHLAGDKALQALSRSIKIFLREYDLVGRFGGEEFALVLPQTDEQDARRVAERMRAHIADMPIEVSSKAGPEIIRVTVSIGVAALSTSGSQLTELLATADAALYRAKHAGRNQVWVTTDTASYSSCVDSGS
jgi:diguanylate cyclase (GGDEF)-like protein